ncbi:MAG: hypothetical protein E7085_05335 [Parabacteroides distasonis]|nr:hypothetical protein [Parabacteroides distasonis]
MKISFFLNVILFLFIPLYGMTQKSFIQKISLLMTDSTEEKTLSDPELLERLRNMPNIEVGKGITFQPNNDLYKLTIRFRMQNFLGFEFGEDFQTDAHVKRLRLRFDGYVFVPQLVYSVQLGFTSYDTKTVPNGNMNIVRDAMVYYLPTNTWSIGFGQTKIKANRARINSSSALQFIDRSIVNSQFNLDRDFGLFGEFHKAIVADFNVGANASITLGEGRNWGGGSNGGYAYSGRLELFPLGRFNSLGEISEGDYQRERTLKLMLGGAYSFNNKAVRLQGQNGALMPDGESRNLNAYFLDFVMKYQGFALCADFMGRKCDKPLFASDSEICVYTGNGLNVQSSYLFPSNWEIAIRNSTLFPKKKVQSLIGYRNFNQTTIGVTKYLIGHSLKIQADASYNHKSEALHPYNQWELRFQVELGL